MVNPMAPQIEATIQKRRMIFVSDHAFSSKWWVMSAIKKTRLLVIWKEMTGKRVVLMAPIHHSFELKAWSETKIILRFWIVASICGAIGFTIYRQSRGL